MSQRIRGLYIGAWSNPFGLWAYSNPNKIRFGIAMVYSAYVLLDWFVGIYTQKSGFLSFICVLLSFGYYELWRKKFESDKKVDKLQRELSILEFAVKHGLSNEKIAGLLNLSYTDFEQETEFPSVWGKASGELKDLYNEWLQYRKQYRSLYYP